MSKPTVSVCMITYGHEQFIQEAIEGVLMQECDFEVELIIADDCSPDNTKSIIESIIANHKRGNWIRYTRHTKNKGISENFVWALNKCNGDYIALCEGDDYWIDTNKLQKQIEFLEGEISIGLVHSAGLIYNQKISKFESIKTMSLSEANLKSRYKNHLVNSFILTPTTCFRREVLNEFLSFIGGEHKKWNLMDYPLWLYFSYHSRIGYLKDVMAVYRVLENSASSRKDRKKRIEAIKGIQTVRNFYFHHYGCENKYKDLIYHQHYKILIQERINLAFDNRNFTQLSLFIEIKRRNNYKILLTDYLKWLFVNNYVSWILFQKLRRVKLILNLFFTL